MIITAFFAFQANQYSKQANRIASQAIEIAKQANSIAHEANSLTTYANQLGENSNAMLSVANNLQKNLLTLEQKRQRDALLSQYQDHFKSGNNPLVFHKLRNEESIQDIRNLQEFTDIFEKMLQGLCSNEIWRSDVYAEFQEQLFFSCNSPQIIEANKIGHSGFKMMCKSFFPDSEMGRFAQTQSIRRCNVNGI